MFARSKAQNDSLLNTMKMFCDSIRVKFGFYKCTIIIMNRDKVFRMKIAL